MALTVVALNDDVPPKEDRGLRLLYTLLSSTISPEDRERILREEYSIESTMEEKKMHSMFYYAMKDSMKKGRMEGREEGEKLGLQKGEKLGLQKGEKLGLQKGEKLGLQKGIAKAYRAIVQNLLSMGKSKEEIQSLLAIPLKEVTSIIGTIQTDG
ncbi:MAG: hypothetical protein J6X55_15035, partial [Victivallales bacterium]|nr:hypothetical protein [Victivallales bacterium]